jgi:hypothetical protein
MPGFVQRADEDLSFVKRVTQLNAELKAKKTENVDLAPNFKDLKPKWYMLSED